MSRANHWCLGVVVGLMMACTSAPQRDVVRDLYELPGGVHSTPTDNDSYYVQPTQYKGCRSIGEAPSCAGGG